MTVPRALAVALILSGALISGCGEGVVIGAGPPQVVAAENMWGSIAAQIAGAHVDSVITNPAQDPHSYEPTASDARALATASLAIVNGIDYDPWAQRLLAANPTPGRVVLNVGALLRVPSGANPHRWYDPTDVLIVARAIAADLERLDPRHRSAYARRLARFRARGLASYHRSLAFIRDRYAGAPVGASESILALLAPALGLRLLTPAGFMKAISEGTEVSARDAAQATDQISRRAIRVWVFNSQNDTPQVDQLTRLARARGIPVTTITETLAPAGASFQQWQVAQLRALARALREGTAR